MTWSSGGTGSRISRKTKQIVRERQDNRCNVIDPRICNGKVEEFDHVMNLASTRMARTDTRADDPDLLQGLCTPCHGQKTSAEGHTAKHARRFRKPLAHPGLTR